MSARRPTYLLLFAVLVCTPLESGVSLAAQPAPTYISREAFERMVKETQATGDTNFLSSNMAILLGLRTPPAVPAIRLKKIQFARANGTYYFGVREETGHDDVLFVFRSASGAINTYLTHVHSFPVLSAASVEGPKQSLHLITRAQAAVGYAEVLKAWAELAPASAAPAAPREPMRVAEPRRTKYVRPNVPMGRVHGMVFFEVTIGPDGKVQNATSDNSTPIAITGGRYNGPDPEQAALAAVKQWEFAPTIVNGVAMSVVTTVVVEFE